MSEPRRVRINLAARAALAERRRAQTRERLLDAAEAVIAEKGAEPASIEDFVRAAGVSRGTFYNYFPTATDLLHALNRRVAQYIDGRLDAMVVQAADPVSRLASSLHTVIATYVTDPIRGWVALQIAHSRAPRQTSLETRFAALYREGVRDGHFRDIEMTAAWTIAFGTLRMMQRDMLAGVAMPVQAVQVVALILSAFGVPYEDAERISRDEAALARPI